MFQQKDEHVTRSESDYVTLPSGTLVSDSLQCNTISANSIIYDNLIIREFIIGTNDTEMVNELGITPDGYVTNPDHINVVSTEGVLTGNATSVNPVKPIIPAIVPLFSSSVSTYQVEGRSNFGEPNEGDSSKNGVWGEGYQATSKIFAYSIVLPDLSSPMELTSKFVLYQICPYPLYGISVSVIVGSDSTDLSGIVVSPLTSDVQLQIKVFQISFNDAETQLLASSELGAQTQSIQFTSATDNDRKLGIYKFSNVLAASSPFVIQILQYPRATPAEISFALIDTNGLASPF